MCGIAGFIEAVKPCRSDELARRVTAMTDRITYRGPDDAGSWTDAEAGVALGHRRLSILDLSSLGHQPMASNSGRYVMVYNGEIYNHHDVRAELLAANSEITFRGTSDTEVILAAVDRWGIKASLERFNGMFSLALWDRQQRILHLTRDRIGEKPLYYGWCGGTFLFGSELKPLMAHPAWTGTLNHAAMRSYVRFGYVLAPQSIFQGICKVIPGTIVSVGPEKQMGQEWYWNPRERVDASISNPFGGSLEEGVDELEKLLRTSVKMRMEADVPLGAFLSGGINSSMIVAMMQAQSSRPVKTFTIGFTVPNYNEAKFAKAIAQHLGTDHTELYLEPNDGLRLIESLPNFYDEPFADSSQIPTMLVAALARKHVTVALSGDGGDELFGGYPRYDQGKRIASLLSRTPRSVRSAAALGLRAVPHGLWKLADQVTGQKKSAERARKIRAILEATSFNQAYRMMLSQWNPENILCNFQDDNRHNPVYDRLESEPDFDKIHTMMYADMVGYLPDDILTKVDRATMSVSLEGRVPFLDHRLVEFAWSLPLAMKYNAAGPKKVLRQALYRYVPRGLIDRPKMGFGAPIASWLRKELRNWATDLLSPEMLRKTNVFDITTVSATLRDHLDGRRDASAQLWSLLMFQEWYQRHETNIARGS